MSEVFLSLEQVAQSWYVIDRADAFAPGQIKVYTVLMRRVVVFCDEQGQLHALDAACPHLGADLGQGQVVGSSLRCAMHHWRFDGAGQCVSAPGYDAPPPRCVRAYPTLVRFGLIWIFNGPRPLFELPALDETWRLFAMPSQLIQAHTHLVIGNGLDADHVQGLHQLQLLTAPMWDEPDAFSVRLRLVSRPRTARAARLLRAHVHPLQTSFTAYGGSLALAHVRGEHEFYTLFTGRQGERGDQCFTQTVIFVRRRRHLGFALPVLYSLLRDDRRALEGMRFIPEFTPRDEPLRLYAQMINRLPVA